MAFGLLIGFLLCFVGGSLLSVVLLFKNVYLLGKNGHVSFWRTTVSLLSLLFSIYQAGLSIAGIVAIAIEFIADTEPHWLDPIILCTLQLSFATTVSVLPTY